MASEFVSPRPSLLTATTLHAILAPGLAAVRRFWKPFLLLQAMALAMVIAYYSSVAVRSACECLASIKQHGGFAFTALSTAFAGAILPEFAKAVVLGDRSISRQRVRDVGFAFAVFAVNGILMDLQYRGMAWVFGNNAQVRTIVKKVLADQFITTPIYGVPYWIIVYELRSLRYRPVAMLRQLSPRWYVDRVLPLLAPAWAFWIPMVSLVYLLPGPLQFCLFLFAAGAWSLLMVFVASRSATSESLPTDA